MRIDKARCAGLDLPAVAAQPGQTRLHEPAGPTTTDIVPRLPIGAAYRCLTCMSILEPQPFCREAFRERIPACAAASSCGGHCCAGWIPAAAPARQPARLLRSEMTNHEPGCLRQKALQLPDRRAAQCVRRSSILVPPLWRRPLFP